MLKTLPQVKLYAFLTLLSISAAFSAQAQHMQKLQRFQTSGMISGYGYHFKNYEHYNVGFLTADISRSIHIPKKNDFVSLYMEPQINATGTANGTDMEFGVNAGIRNYIKINPGFYIYQMLGSGPHFITAKLKTQATGFIFSDNLFAGVLARVHRNTFFNFQCGVRHISNASLKKPNRGMNTFNVRLGISLKK